MVFALDCIASNEYFSSKDNQCFGTALANLLLVQGDKKMANKVYKDYRKHPFVLADGSTYSGVYTRLVADLTENQYNSRAIDWMNHGTTEEIYSQLEEMYPSNLINVLEAALEERRQERNINLDFQSISEDAKIIPPCIICAKVKYNIFAKAGNPKVIEIKDFVDMVHNVVFSKNNKIIDGSFIINYSSDYASLMSVDGFLTIAKK